MKITGQTGPRSERHLCAAEAILLRYGLALIFLWIGAMKFTAYEAEGIRPLAENSPLMSWLLAALGIRAFSNLLGVIEIATGVLLALRPVSASATVIGSGMAIATFLTTLTFLFTTPGWEQSLGGFPALSALPGQFLLKDVVLLGAAVWALREGSTALRTREPAPSQHQGSTPCRDRHHRGPSAKDANKPAINYERVPRTFGDLTSAKRACHPEGVLFRYADQQNPRDANSQCGEE